MRRPVFGAGSWHEETPRAPLASYEAFTSLRFLIDGLGRRVESRKLDKYIINGNEYLEYPGNPFGNKSRPAQDYFPRVDWGLFTKRLDVRGLLSAALTYSNLLTPLWQSCRSIPA
jgi:hypothetical protein